MPTKTVTEDDLFAFLVEFGMEEEHVHCIIEATGAKTREDLKMLDKTMLQQTISSAGFPFAGGPGNREVVKHMCERFGHVEVLGAGNFV